MSQSVSFRENQRRKVENFGTVKRMETENQNESVQSKHGHNHVQSAVQTMDAKHRWALGREQN